MCIHQHCQVLFDINIPVEPHDLSNLIGYLSLATKSGGGQILELESTKKSLIVVYESAEAARRILAKKYFRFKHYFIRSSRRGYTHDIYTIYQNRILIQWFSKESVETMLRIANSIFPGNELIELKQLKTFSNTYLLQYKHDLQKIESNRKTQLRMRMFNAFATRTILFKPSDQLNQAGFHAFKERLKLQLHFKQLNTVFLDEKEPNAFYVQFDTDFELKHFMRCVLNCIYDEGIIYEYCFNFQLKNESLDFLF